MRKLSVILLAVFVYSYASGASTPTPVPTKVVAAKATATSTPVPLVKVYLVCGQTGSGPIKIDDPTRPDLGSLKCARLAMMSRKVVNGKTTYLICAYIKSTDVLAAKTSQTVTYVEEKAVTTTAKALSLPLTQFKAADH